MSNRVRLQIKFIYLYFIIIIACFFSGNSIPENILESYPFSSQGEIHSFVIIDFSQCHGMCLFGNIQTFFLNQLVNLISGQVFKFISGSQASLSKQCFVDIF